MLEMSERVRNIVNEYKANPTKCIEQLESCGYGCEAGVMVNNVAWIAIKELLLERSIT